MRIVHCCRPVSRVRAGRTARYHAHVARAVYPGLKSHPQHDVAARQQRGYGAVVAFCCAGGREQAAMVLTTVQKGKLARSGKTLSPEMEQAIKEPILERSLLFGAK